MALMKLFPDEFEWPMRWSRQFMEDTTLKVEEFVDDDEMVVRAEMPGIDPDEDVEITVANHQLHLRAERRTETTTDDKHGFRSEFHYGSFERSLRLPTGATEDDVTATYHDGILEVRIPIDTETVDTKRIPVARS